MLSKMKKIQLIKFKNYLVIQSPFSSSIINLNDTNYLKWRTQIFPIFRGHKLDKYVLGDDLEFMKMIAMRGEEQLEFTMAKYSKDQQVWILQDQLLQSWLIPAISSFVIGQLVGIRTSRKLFYDLAMMYASQYEINIIQLRVTLQQTKKGSMSISEYCIKIKTIADQILAGGGHISEAELVVYILGELGDDYDTLAQTLTTRSQLSRGKNSS